MRLAIKIFERPSTRGTLNEPNRDGLGLFVLLSFFFLVAALSSNDFYPLGSQFPMILAMKQELETPWIP